MITSLWVMLFFFLKRYNSEYVERVIPFNSSRKKMTTAWSEDTKIKIFVKGASEIILDKCINIDIGSRGAKITLVTFDLLMVVKKGEPF